MMDIVKDAPLIAFAGMSASLLTFAVGSEVQALLAWV
jgi:hypothetical protein